MKNYSFDIPRLKILSKKELKTLNELGFGINISGELDLFETVFLLAHKDKFQQKKFLNIKNYRKFVGKHKKKFSNGPLIIKIYYDLYDYLRIHGYLSVFSSKHNALLVMRKGRHISDEAYAYLVKYFDSGQTKSIDDIIALVNLGKILRKEIIIATKNKNNEFLFYTIKNTVFE